MQLPRQDMAFGSCSIPIDPSHPGQLEYQGQAAAAALALRCCFPLHLSCHKPWAHSKLVGCAQMSHALCKSAGLVRGQHSSTSSGLCIQGWTKDWCFHYSLDFQSAGELSLAHHTSQVFQGGCVWNDGSAEGTNSSTTGEGRQGMAIFWDQKKANSLLILQ